MLAGGAARYSVSLRFCDESTCVATTGSVLQTASRTASTIACNCSVVRPELVGKNLDAGQARTQCCPSPHSTTINIPGVSKPMSATEIAAVTTSLGSRRTSLVAILLNASCRDSSEPRNADPSFTAMRSVNAEDSLRKVLGFIGIQ